MLILGIDPGLSGGIAVMHQKSGKVETKFKMPIFKEKGGSFIQSDQIIEFFFDIYKPTHTIIEKQHSRPTDGKRSLNKTLVNYGILLGIIESYCLTSDKDVSFNIVNPSSWQIKMFEGVDKILDKKGKKDTKEMAREKCRKLWPEEDFRATKRSRIMHDGICDAMLITEYGREYVF